MGFLGGSRNEATSKFWIVYFMEHPKLKWMRTAGTPHFFSSKTMGIFWASTIWRDKPTYSSPRGVEISPSLSGRRVVLIFMEGTLKWPLDGYHKAERCNKPWPCHQTWQWRADCWRPICHRSVSKIGYSTSPWWGSQHFFGDFIMKNNGFYVIWYGFNNWILWLNLGCSWGYNGIIVHIVYCILTLYN